MAWHLVSKPALSQIDGSEVCGGADYEATGPSSAGLAPGATARMSEEDIRLAWDALLELEDSCQGLMVGSSHLSWSEGH